MGKRHPNHRLVKHHRSYTVEEVARLFGMHKNTVRTWVKNGLRVIDEKRPTLIHGYDLIDFLKARREKNKQKCRPEELYCVKCRMPKIPAGNLVEYSPITDTFGNLKAICPDCESIINKRFSVSRIREIYGNIDVMLPEKLRHIIKRTEPFVNSDLREGV